MRINATLIPFHDPVISTKEILSPRKESDSCLKQTGIKKARDRVERRRNHSPRSIRRPGDGGDAEWTCKKTCCAPRDRIRRRLYVERGPLKSL